MQKIIWLITGCGFLLTSCQKSIDVPGNRPAGVDSTSPGLIMKYVEAWSSSTDTIVTIFKYNNGGFLVEEKNSPAFFGITNYFRDSKNRVARTSLLLGANDTAFTDVYYANENSGMIAYTLSHATHSGAKKPDSNVYVYNGSQLTKTVFYNFVSDTAFCGNYYTWAYDSKNNISQLINYTRNPDGTYGYNIGYDFTYDDKPNPFFSHDQVRQTVNWYISSSPNNLIKQVNHYGIPPIMPDDYIEMSYAYDSTGVPGTSIRTGSAIGTIVVHSSYYYK